MKKNGFESLKKQMGESLQKTELELEDLAKKLEDKDYMDSLSPSADEELRMRFQALSQDFGRFQNQYYQLLNQANMKMLQSLHNSVCSAAELVRDRNHLTFLMNEDSVFACTNNLNFTDEVVKEMDKKFDVTQATAQLDAR